MSNNQESKDVVTISRGALVGIIIVVVFVVGLLAGLVLPKFINNNGGEQTAVVQAAPAPAPAAPAAPAAAPASSSGSSHSGFTPSVPSIYAGDPPAEVPITAGRFSTTSIRELSMSDLYGLSLDDLDIMRNEIYARHGYIFSSDKLRRYFSAQPWYIGFNSDPKSVYSEFNAVEKKNVQLIKQREKDLKGR